MGEFKLELQSGNAQVRSKSAIFLSCVTFKFDRWNLKTIGHLFYTTSSFVHHFKDIGESKFEIQSKNAQFGSKSAIFCSVWPSNLMDDLENNRDLFYSASSFANHFIAISEFKLELQSKNAQFGSKSIFMSSLTLKFDRWSWKTIGHIFYATSSFVHHFKAIGDFKVELQPGNTQFESKLMIFLAMWPWNLMDDLKNKKGTSPKQNQGLCIISSSYVNSNWSYGPKTVKLGFDLSDLDLWPLTLTFCIDITSVIGNNPWKFHGDTMRGT